MRIKNWNGVVVGAASYTPPVGVQQGATLSSSFLPTEAPGNYYMEISQELTSNIWEMPQGSPPRLRVLACSSNFECSAEQSCQDNQCVAVSCPSGFVENHACVPYGCSSNQECLPGSTCDLQARECKPAVCNPSCGDDEVCVSGKCEQAKLILEFVPVNWRYDKPFALEVDRQVRAFAEAFPISACLDRVKVVKSTEPCNIPVTYSCDPARVVTACARRYTQNFDFVVGLGDSAQMCGFSCGTGTVMVGNPNICADFTTAHELGHEFRLPHSTGTSVMGSHTKPYHFDPYELTVLKSSPLLDCSAAPTRRATPTPSPSGPVVTPTSTPSSPSPGKSVPVESKEEVLVVLADLDVYRNDSVVSRQVTVVKGRPTEDQPQGSYSMRLLDGKGSVLEQRTLDIQFKIFSLAAASSPEHATQDLDRQPVTVKLPYSTNVSRLSLLREEKTLLNQTVETCNHNNLCEEFENSLTCPADCPSGGKDNYCDASLERARRDGVCDPDCAADVDVDCTCGNGICDGGETRATCPTDCSISLAGSKPGSSSSRPARSPGFEVSVAITALVVAELVRRSNRRGQR